MRQHHDSNVDMAIIALMRDSLLLPHEVAGARWEDLTPAEDGPRKLPIASSKDNRGPSATSAPRQWTSCPR